MKNAGSNRGKRMVENKNASVKKHLFQTFSCYASIDTDVELVSPILAIDVNDILCFVSQQSPIFSILIFRNILA